MPAFASWFRVHPTLVLAQAHASAAQLANPALTTALIDLQLVGLDGSVLRRTLDRARHDLQDHLDWQAEAAQRRTEVLAERAEASRAFFHWRARLFARLRFAARRGADPERRFSTVFGYRRVPAPRAAGLVTAGADLFAALSSRSASLAPHGLDSAFVAEGQAAYHRLCTLHDEAAATLADRKAATTAVRRACDQVQEQLLILVAADDAAALETGRPPAFALAVLRPATSPGADAP